MIKQTKLDEQSIAIADAVKAEAARVGVSGKRLAQDIGRDRNYIYERFRYEKPFDTNDLSIIAKSLGISLESLFQSATFGQQIHRAFAPTQVRAA
ncbi:hypothetical protein [Bifidobacterium mongoliense]|uniref:HTH cro/C1-type domain-containing protein n=1 Tax=Bifidobacterium mongoliense DSM 21395 TaxID=1437603 RepID=A0A087BZX3_9BIFI|nr:hypothetical protein [Bifidobacterium mongoliense]KFI76573.1 hypothetical protein BMON_1171 [Bifidobacterium mongoliense DSM 21395]